MNASEAPQPIEAVAIIGKGWWRWHGKLEFRRLATPGRPFDSFWVECGRGDGGWAPLYRRRDRERLIEALRSYAESIGPLARFEVRG